MNFKCSECKNNISGFIYKKFKSNKMVKQKLLCGGCWILEGKPKPRGLLKLFN